MSMVVIEFNYMAVAVLVLLAFDVLFLVVLPLLMIVSCSTALFVGSLVINLRGILVPDVL